MLRLLVAALLIANLLFWAWHQPAVTEVLGLAPPGHGERKPERLRKQVRPEAVRLLPPALATTDTSRGATPASAASPDSASPPVAASAASGDDTLCLEAGPLNDSAASAAARQLAQAGVPAGAWVDVRRELPGRWVVYMGRFTDRETLQRKLEEVQRMNLAANELRSPAELAPGLTLGEFGAQADAEARLDRLQARGVRTARVLQLPSPGAEHRLRAERVERSAAEKLAAQEPRNGQARWQPCAP